MGVLLRISGSSLLCLLPSPPSISDFSEESQSILRDNVEFAVPVPGRDAPGADVSCGGRSADASPGDGAEAMDSSVSLKRKGVPADASAAERPSRSRLCEPHRKVKPQASSSSSSRGGEFIEDYRWFLLPTLPGCDLVFLSISTM